MNIGQAAKASGVSAKMIRYYEETGLIRAAERSASGYRVYTSEDVHTLRFIRRARDLGFSVKQITLLLSLWQDKNRESAQVKQVAMDHIAELRSKIRELQQMIDVLGELADNCQGDHRPNCPILNKLEA